MPLSETPWEDYGRRVERVSLEDATRPVGGSTRLDGELARPAGTGPWPGVVLLHEIFGIDDVMRRHAQRLAAAGYLVLCVDLYSAGGLRRCLVATMRSLYSGRGRAYLDIAAARDWLRANPLCSGRVGVIGFCMGGGFVLASAGDGFDVGAVNYGQLPKHYDDLLREACPLGGSDGANDPTLKGAARRLESTLSAAGIAHDIKEYEGAGHSFLNDAPVGPRPLRPLLRVAGMGPRPEAAADAWARIEEFFGRYLS